jgi:hypothetical protein
MVPMREHFTRADSELVAAQHFLDLQAGLKGTLYEL